MGGWALILLDTHSLIWLDQDDPTLGPVARQRADAALKDHCLAISAISFWEIAMLVAKGRIVMDLPPLVWRQDLLRSGLIEIPVDGEIGITAVHLEHLHRVAFLQNIPRQVLILDDGVELVLHVLGINHHLAPAQLGSVKRQVLQ